MQIVIDVPEKLAYEGFERSFTEEEKNILIKAIGNGIPLSQPFDLEGLKSDMKALNCGYPYGLDYLLDCLNRRLGITISEVSDANSD